MNTGMLQAIAGEYTTYQLIKSLGQGAFGRTYLAEDENGHEYAVKKLTFSSNSQSYAKAKELFEREVESLKKLNGYPHIPNFVEYIEENQQFYLVQQYINGKTLTKELESRGKFTIEDAIKILQCLLKVLIDIHENNIIHRDIKPDNIMIDHENNLFLIDFGAVKEIIPNQTKLQTPGTRIFTPGYAPLEQQYGYAEKNSDIYALGIIIIQLITGLEPENQNFDDWQNQIIISDDLKYILSILSKMIHKEHKYRYQSAQEIIDDLQIPSLQKNQPIIPNNHVNLSQESGMDIIFFAMLLIMISIVIFNAAFLPGIKKKENQKQQSFLIHKVYL